MSDLYLSLYFLISLVFLLIILDFLHKKSLLNQLITRKITHALVGVLIVVASFYFASNITLLIIAAVFAIINLYCIITGKLTSIHGKDKSLGTVYYPISVFFLAFLFWDNNIIIFRISILIMTISDAFAAIFGEKYGKNHFALIKDKKSILGAIVMFLSTLIIVFSALYLWQAIDLLSIVYISIAVALISTAAELLSINGSDNLSVPVFSVLFLFSLLSQQGSLIFNQIIIGIFLSLGLVIVSYKFKFLSASGAVATFLLGSVVFGLGGIKYTIPILTFFILSSFLSFFGKRKKEEVEKTYEKSGTRDYAQVIANGGIAGLIVIVNYFYDHSFNYIIYLTVIAAVTADTWATELGFFSKRLPRLITNFTHVPKGTSGAISITGTFFSILGTVMIALIGCLLADEIFLSMGIFNSSLIIIFCGSLACMFDSLLGATIQAQYLCKSCQSSTEKKIHCNEVTQLKSGFKAVNNDAVNLISSIFSICVASIILFLF